MVTLLDETFISTDAGNGWAAVYRLLNGKVKSHGIPHARARVTGAKMETDLGAQNIADFADFMGSRYGYGDGIWNLTDTPIDMHQNTARRYGSTMHIFLMMVNIAELGVKSGSELTLIVPAPPGLLNEVASIIKRALLDGETGAGGGRWSIQLRGDKKPREYKIKRVITMPEGAGAFAAFRFNTAGDAVPLVVNNSDALDGRVTVLDLGAGTGDSYTIYNGNLNPDALAHSTDSKAGVIHNLLRPILGDVLEAVPQAQSYLTTAHIDSYLRQYMKDPKAENAIIRVSGQNINIEESIISHAFRYAEWIAANKIDPLFSSGIDALVMAGGGWSYIDEEIKRNYSGRLILEPKMFPHTRNIPMWDLNGVGQLHFAAAVMKQQQV